MIIMLIGPFFLFNALSLTTSKYDLLAMDPKNGVHDGKRVVYWYKTASWESSNCFQQEVERSEEL